MANFTQRSIDGSLRLSLSDDKIMQTKEKTKSCKIPPPQLTPSSLSLSHTHTHTQTHAHTHTQTHAHTQMMEDKPIMYH